jgi:hypothetical protein
MAKTATPLKSIVTALDDGMIPYELPTERAGHIRIIIDGRSPLLTHNPESMTTKKDAKKGTRIPEPDVEAEAGVYRMDDGTCAIKGEAVRASLLIAALDWKEKRRSVQSRLAHITVVEQLLPLMRKDGTPISDYRIDARRAIVMGKGIIRHRPCFDEWSIAPTIEYDPILVTDPMLLVSILQDSGGRIGLGDYRPKRNGWFGRFNVRCYKMLD